MPGNQAPEADNKAKQSEVVSEGSIEGVEPQIALILLRISYLNLLQSWVERGLAVIGGR